MNKVPDTDNALIDLDALGIDASIGATAEAENTQRPVPTPDSSGQTQNFDPAVHEQLGAQLAKSGLNLYACLDLYQVQQSGITGFPVTVSGTGQASLLMVGNSGPEFWSASLRSIYCEDANPVDAYATAAVLAALSRCSPQRRVRLLYPTADCVIPLQRLGQLAGWHQQSPLGTGIDPEWGLWFAYRALVLINAGWIATKPRVQSTNVCAECSSQACLTACPASALTMDTGPNLRACAEYRIGGNASAPAENMAEVKANATTGLCAETCLARCACPVAPEQRYSQDQLRHHYSRSLGALRRWIDPKSI